MGERHADGRKVFFKEKTVLIALVLLFVFALLCLPVAEAQAYNKCSAVLLMDAQSGEILYGENADVKMEIASTTKILTAITVIENADIFMTAQIPTEAVGVEGSSIYLKKGERWTVIDLLYGLMLRSGNDAATALAVITSGNVDNFVRLMNVTAGKAGAKNSNFTNPHGLHDDNHYSTASDMARITAYAMKCRIFSEIVKTKTHRAVKVTPEGRENVVFYNKNKLLNTYPYATGVKTGYTKHSGRCLVSAAEKDGQKLICVALNVGDTYGVTKRLFDGHFDKNKGDHAEIS